MVLLTHLHQLIKATPRRKFSQANDKLGWISSTNGSFDPQNSYKMATGNPHIVSNLWLLDMEHSHPSENFSFLFGNACKIVLPVKQILMHRGILKSNTWHL